MSINVHSTNDVIKAARIPPPQPKKTEGTSDKISEILPVQQANDNYNISGMFINHKKVNINHIGLDLFCHINDLGGSLVKTA